MQTIKNILDKHEITYPPCGASCPSGWLKLVEDLIEDLIILGWDKRLAQIKIKYGWLCFYIEYSADDGHVFVERIYEAERQAARTCQECGVSGKGITTQMPVCPGCAKRLNYK